MNQKFIDFMESYQNSRLAVAVSGGADSVCLLHWLAELNLRPVVLHVNHGLRDAAEAETEYVAAMCEKLRLPCKVFYWGGAKPESNLESAARDARYELMTDYCRKNEIEALLTAHQADDQIETFIMNLGRGSGVWGLAAMRDETMRDGVKIVRPLLKVFRRELEEYCHALNIKYFADEMNEDEKYARVRIRKNRHLLCDMLGISDERILLAVDNLSRTREALEIYIESRIKSDPGLRRGDGNQKSVIFHKSFLFDEPLEIRLKLLGRLIQEIGEGKYQPRLNSLRLALHNLGNDCKFTLGGCTVRRLRAQILIARTGESTSFRKQNAK